MAGMTGNRAFIEMLRAEGVRCIFDNPGTRESAIMASSPAYPGIEYPLATQERVAIGVADGYATARSLPSFVNLHIETDLANGINLLHHAKDGGTPLGLTSATRTFAS